ncbi:MAG: hypothetical protein ACRDJC_19620 [Thermomicrobiales bacterium]
MDGQHFDHLTLQLTTLLNRRRVSRALVLIGLGATLGLTTETAAKKKRGKKKRKCKNGAVRCGKVCVNTQNNALHCGRCGRRCGSTVACVNGDCQGGGCLGTQILCNELCVDPDDNEQHCGGCHNPCTDPLTCIDGECACAGTVCDDACVNTDDDPDHCGGCDQPCDPGEGCANGECVAVCNPPCPAGRDCHNGDCTCRGNFDCELELNPNGNFCLGTPPICRCPDDTTVCAAGEACSPCCNNETCANFNPGFETIVCSTVPPNVLGVRTCCVPTDGECGGNQQCCSGFCDTNTTFPGTCVCIPTGSQEVCVEHEACCSGVCSGITRRCE